MHSLAQLPKRELQRRIQRVRHASLPVPNHPLQPAAVLVPLMYREGQWHILLTRRTHRLRNHKGQVAFPGGRCEEADDGVVITALRETFEEIGIPPHLIEVLGELPKQPVVSGYLVTPVVGVLAPTAHPRISPDEIARIFYVPLSWLANPLHIERVEQHQWGDMEYPVPFYVPYEGEIIWGMTARIILSLIHVLTPTTGT